MALLKPEICILQKASGENIYIKSRCSYNKCLACSCKCFQYLTTELKPYDFVAGAEQSNPPKIHRYLISRFSDSLCALTSTALAFHIPSIAIASIISMSPTEYHQAGHQHHIRRGLFLLSPLQHGGSERSPVSALYE